MNHLNDALSEVPSRAHGPTEEPSEAELAKHRNELTEKLKRAERELNGRRRVVHFQVTRYQTYALCDDGTLWQKCPETGTDWTQLDGPPGTEGGVS